jgi:hypothetical protein
MLNFASPNVTVALFNFCLLRAKRLLVSIAKVDKIASYSFLFLFKNAVAAISEVRANCTFFYIN